MTKRSRQLMITTTTMMMITTVLSCVPDGVPTEPRGGIGVVSEPSAATRGEPFTTKDGFTVRIERVAIFMMLTALPPGARGRMDGEFGERLFLWNASLRSELDLRAIEAGPRSLRFEVQGRGKFIIEGAERSFYLNVNLDKSVEDRLRLPPEGFEDIALDPDSPPMQVGVILTAKIEKPEMPARPPQAVAIDIALLGQPTPTEKTIDVIANTLTLTTMDVFAERFFEVTEGAAALIFNADTNHDGKVSGAELRAVKTTDENEDETTLLNQLVAQTGKILVPR